MSSPPPTKPPRGVKQGKETSGLLMSVIRTLSASETNEQREKERAKLEKEYKKSDARLDELVAAHASEITEVMQMFSAVSAALGSWGQHCAAAEARMAACRALLRLRREDLRRLWADARAHHHALRTLSDIEAVVLGEREARELASAGRVLGAAVALRAARQTQRTLLHVSALSAITDQLEAKRRSLTALAVKRISAAVYSSGPAPLARRLSARRRTALLLAELTKTEEVTDAYLQDVTPEFEASLSEEDATFETHVMIALEALGALDSLEDATETFKVQIQTELLEVIDTVSRRIAADDGDNDVDPDGEGDDDDELVDGVEGGRTFGRLVACLAEEFQACGLRHKRLLQLWRAALTRHGGSEKSLHAEHHYWSAVQQVMQLLLTEYLEIESVTLAAARAARTPTHPRSLAEYFAKKRPQRRKEKLFKLTVPVPVAETGSRRGRYPLVCRVQPALLYAALPALHTLCALIERPGGGECSLRAFIADYVRWGESERLARAARDAIDAAARAPAAWRERVAPPHDPEGRPIAACAAAGWAALSHVARAARRCGSCGAGAARALTAALGALCTVARAQHARAAPPASPARAARWLADDDIVRFLQALPTYLDAPVRNKAHPQELKQAYEREAEILGSSLGDGEIAAREVVADIDALVDLAVLCESMSWLSGRVQSLPAELSALKSEQLARDVSAAAEVLDEIAHKCLLFLHLELRIECFHYLGQEDAGEEEAGGAARLAHRLLAFHERAAPALRPHALAYIMNGLGEMMSAAVVWRWQTGGGAAGAGARLAALRHCLAALSLPHDGLHAAHKYLQLLACDPEEIIRSVREKGPEFSELEYLNAFKVIGARRNLSPAELRTQLQRLSAALGHVGVTV
ncbi:exocyst complex component 4 [Aricia agestis]|uniref:exocyst complex component 4 n=1 Tax=Aricia agestis TaxID=91739 RepID=UPI001C207D14|nr:exocyst complex component 4 [Aricia agestis]